MKVQDIYQKLGTPPNLQEHMLRVTSVALFIINHWRGSPLDPDLVQSILLLHDIGNIVKFDLKKHPEFLGPKEMGRVDYWIQRQSAVIQKYGTDDHEATMAMLDELGIAQDVRNRIYGMGYWDAKTVMESSDWYLKISLYADLRVGPLGIVSLQERLNDVHTRLPKYREHPELRHIANSIEAQIQKYLDVHVSAINEENVGTNTDLLHFDIVTTSV